MKGGNMAKVEMKDIFTINDASIVGGHVMVHYMDAETNTGEWACSCGDLSGEVRENLDAINAAASEAFEIKGVETGRMTSASSAFEYEDDKTFVRGYD
jgi:hypothetical protein